MLMKLTLNDIEFSIVHFLNSLFFEGIMSREYSVDNENLLNYIEFSIEHFENAHIKNDKICCFLRELRPENIPRITNPRIT